MTFLKVMDTEAGKITRVRNLSQQELLFRVFIIIKFTMWMADNHLIIKKKIDTER